MKIFEVISGLAAAFAGTLFGIAVCSLLGGGVIGTVAGVMVAFFFTERFLRG